MSGKFLYPGIFADEVEAGDYAGLQHLLDVMRLDNTQEDIQDEHIDLVFAGTHTAYDKWRKRGRATIHLAHDGTFHLPRDQENIAALIQHTVSSRRRGVRLLVVRWNRSADEQHAACRLAHSLHAHVLDMRGRGPGHVPFTETSGIRWADLRTEEPAFPRGIDTQFPNVGRTRVLGADGRGGVFADSALLPRVLDALSEGQTAVVNVGQWDDRAQIASSYADMVIFVGRSRITDIHDLCAAICQWEPQCAYGCLFHGRISALTYTALSEIKNHAFYDFQQLHPRRYPRTQHGWKALSQEILTTVTASRMKHMSNNLADHPLNDKGETEQHHHARAWSLHRLCRVSHERSKGEEPQCIPRESPVSTHEYSDTDVAHSNMPRTYRGRHRKDPS
ncbi:hypothetical protein [Schaalia sp. lx-260]|uniref:hypothetical protein n=1 Tax=Schaalia sp. lx-260 TaxID=2899082 RepID=UPI001E550A9C|nr:hypothetical protein [Schaalia sp. lx-260]MCD4548833.1 hypothetical protein [Schaalia sp. lx-260]